MSRRHYGPCSWFALLATLGSLLPPTAVLAENRAIRLQGDGGDAWTFEKNLEGVMPEGGCDEALVASPRATVEAWQTDGRFGTVVPLLEGDNEVRAICSLGEGDRSVSEPQHWRVRLRDAPKAWIRIVPAEDGVLLDAGASEPAPARSAPIVNHQWGSVPRNPQPLRTADGAMLGNTPLASNELLLRTPGIEGVTTYFDWENLKNLNYDNPEVQRYMIEAFAYWVREFGIDGFRADAAWGVRERAPEFWPRLRDELKRIDPDLLLLAEASARDPYYDVVGFDAAYDWTNRLGEWAWHDAFEAGASTAARLRAALIGSRSVEADGPMPRSGALVFRFLNNNDTGERFVSRYGVARTRLAATMLLTLPGLPLLYTGEEVGAEFEPYDEGPMLSWTDPHGLREHYARLVALRRDHAELRSERLEILKTSHPESVLAYLRPGEQRADDIIVLLN
jgi:hypothetical protein